MDRADTSLIVLLASIGLIVVGLAIVVQVQGSFKSECLEVDSLDRRAIPMEIRGNKYPTLRLKLLDDSLEEECSVGLGRKLYRSDDTLNVRIYLNRNGERIRAEIIDENVEH